MDPLPTVAMFHSMSFITNYKKNVFSYLLYYIFTTILHSTLRFRLNNNRRIFHECFIGMLHLANLIPFECCQLKILQAVHNTLDYIPCNVVQLCCEKSTYESQSSKPLIHGICTFVNMNFKHFAFSYDFPTLTFFTSVLWIDAFPLTFTL